MFLGVEILGQRTELFRGRSPHEDKLGDLKDLRKGYLGTITHKQGGASVAASVRDMDAVLDAGRGRSGEEEVATVCCQRDAAVPDPGRAGRWGWSGRGSPRARLTLPTGAAAQQQ